jgi:ElaB/YqjD/DUF883 family membrane-anchored ribosome-binding protein
MLQQPINSKESAVRKRALVGGNDGIDNPLHYVVEVGTKALDAVQSGASLAGSTAQTLVRKHPLASVGIAFGGGLAVAALGLLLVSTLRPAP